MFRQVVTLLDQYVGLLLFGTSSSYFAIDNPTSRRARRPARPSGRGANLSSGRIRVALSVLKSRCRCCRGSGAASRSVHCWATGWNAGLPDRHGLAEVDRFIFPLRAAFPAARRGPDQVITHPGLHRVRRWC